MPGGDGTGPGGMGPMTGRAAGYCAGYGTPGFANPVGGRGFGYGRGFGRGYGRGFGYGRGLGRGFRGGRGYGWGAGYAPAAYPAYGYAPAAAPITAEQEIEGLKTQASYFQDSVNAINERIAELEKEAKTK